MYAYQTLARELRKHLLAIFCLLPLISGVQAQTETATLNSGNSPAAIAVNPVNDKIYVANKADNTLP